MSYGQLNLVKDTATRTLLKALFEQLAAQQRLIATLQGNALQRGEAVAARLEDVYDPQANTDAVNVQYLKRYVSAQRTGTAYVPPEPPAGIPGTPNTPPSNPTNPLPDETATVQAVFAANPGFVATSCQSAPGGTWDLMDAIVDALRAVDPNFAYNGKRGNVNDPSNDAVSYYYGSGTPAEGDTEVFIVDVIAGHCGDNPQPAFQDVTIFAPGVWITRGRF